MIEWNGAKDTSGRVTREFRITRDGKRDITGALWLPEKNSLFKTLVCFGHGASGNRYQAPICHLAKRFSTEAGLPVLSLDGPVHGLRQVGDGGRTAFFPEFQREDALSDMTEEWHATIDAITALPEVGNRNIAYFGLSMESIFGIPMIASRDDVVVATLGLFGIQDNFPHGKEYLEMTPKISCPILFLMQLEDELFDRGGYLHVFDLLASGDKRIHANPGLHPQIPAEEIDFAFDFMVSHIEGTSARKIINPLAE